MNRVAPSHRNPIRLLLDRARIQVWRIRYALGHSADTSAKSSSRVQSDRTGPIQSPPRLDLPERHVLLALARDSIQAEILGSAPPSPAEENLSPNLFEPRACFVTLTTAGMLRGCIGSVRPLMPLYQAVLVNARRSATEDPRFPPLARRELPQLHIELSVLTPPTPLLFSSPEELLRKLRPGQDGVVLTMHGREVTYLPQVWQHLPEPERFLASLSEKAGCRASAWSEPGIQVSIYEVESFADSGAALSLHPDDPMHPPDGPAFSGD